MNRITLYNKTKQCLLLFASLIVSIQLAHADDQYLQGYLSAILEQQLGWQSGSYHIKVERAVATISIVPKNNRQISLTTQAFAKVPGLVDFNFIELTDITHHRLHIFIIHVAIILSLT